MNRRISRSKQGRAIISHGALLRLIALYISVGLVYALVTPVLEKPDEDGHYGYILYLQKHGKLPPLAFSGGFPSEYKQPPLYYVITSILTSYLPDTTDPDDILTVNPYMDFSVPGYRNDNRNVFLHPPYMTPPILASRLVSLVFGLGTVVASYLLTMQLFPKKSRIPIATAAIVGFHPKFLYIATAVNNDTATAFFGTVALTILTVRLRKSEFTHFAVLLGGTLGLASITKVSGLVFFPLTGIGLLVIHRGFSRGFFRDGIIILTTALLIGGWWYVRNGLLYDDPLSLGTHISVNSTTRPFLDRIKHDLSSIEHTFWANPSRTFVSQMWLDNLLIRWGRLSLLLLILSLILNYRSASIKNPAWIILLSWPMTFFFLLTTYWTRKSSWAYGRLLFPAIAPIALFFALGWKYVLPQRRRQMALTFGTSIVIIIGVLEPFVSIYPLYHPWQEWESEQIQHPADMVYVDTKTETPVARLLGYNLVKPFSSPGTYLPVELCWEPLSQTTTRYSVFIHLLDLSQLSIHRSPGVWGTRRTYPGLGNLPTDRWTPGKPFCDRVLVQISPDTPTPLGAAIEIGFIDSKNDTRLQAVTTEGEPFDLAVFRGTSILSPDAMPAVERSACYVVDQAIGLDHVHILGITEDTIKLTLMWQSIRAVPYDATTFIHLIGTDGRLLVQADRQPLNGQFPTSYWIPGQVVTDTVTLSPVHNAYNVPLTLILGMYTWPSLERLPVMDASGALQPDNAITINISFLSSGQEMAVP
jgi:4-amino-4-deoxy-L-arabinose transferase-like glycosyltransferase